ncbi:MAG TPA: His-Xaa-Ser system protein HxsD [Candidatus Nanopelagicales bacterium]|nr:His-Xaa-Ser system protein HxsD [Candidatus Nanopelagicales bacterium]
MSDIKATLDRDALRIELDEQLYPKDAIYGAAYVFIDRCYVHLDRAGDGRIVVTLRAKRGGPELSEAFAGEMQNELLAQAWRQEIASQNRQLIESITARALGGAAGPAGLDELLAMDIGEASAFEDPLGIAMSWEEKYGKKKTKAADKVEGAPEAAADGEAPKAAGGGEAS